MDHLNAFKRLKVGFIGAGNMGQTLIGGLIKGQFDASMIFATTRTEAKLPYLEKTYGIKTFLTNEELVEACDVIVLAVKPQDLYEVLEPLHNIFDDNKIVISLAAGVGIDQLKKWLYEVKRIIRVMPNTPSKIGQGVLGYAMTKEAEALSEDLEDFLSPLGFIVAAPEGDAFEALTVGCGSGIGFVFEVMQYWQDWLEDHGFEADVARQMTLSTFLGTALLADENKNLRLEDLQKKVVSKKGVTLAGLQSFRENDLERILRLGFERAVSRDRELGRESSET